MICKGPDSEVLFSQKVDMNYEKYGNEKLFLEFNMNEKMRCIVMLISGSLILKGWLFSLNRINSHIIEKVPCLVCCPGTFLDAKSWNFYGDSWKEVFTCGVLISEWTAVSISDWVFKDHLGGGIIANLIRECTFRLFNNRIYTWETVGIYIQGDDTTPMIEWNEIKNCKCTGIKIFEGVDAEILENNLKDTNNGIEIYNNRSHLFNNEIDKSHGDGIIFICDYTDK